MLNQEWTAECYAIGSYIQATIADKYLSQLELNPTDKVLDIGCGNGAYTQKILDRVPQGSVLGIDASGNMLALAREVQQKYPNFSIKKENVSTMSFTNQFDYVVSFWCLQWAEDIKQACTQIIRALKPKGRFFALIPAGNDPFIRSYYALKKSGQFASLNHFKPSIDYSKMNHLVHQLQSIACSELTVDLEQSYITLASLDIFRKFVNGISFYQGQIPEDEVQLLNEAMVQWFAEECQRHYQGEYQFHYSLYIIKGQK